MSELILWMDREINKMKKDMDRLFRETWPEIGVDLFREKFSQQIPVETFMTDDAFVVRAVIPGVDPKSLDITAVDYQLTIRGSKKEESDEQNGYVRHVQRKLRSFSRTIPLPFKPVRDNIKATLRNDVLTIRIAREDPEKKRYIRIEIA